MGINHAFTAGLFAGAGYEVSSTLEQGTEHVDILIKIENSET